MIKLFLIIAAAIAAGIVSIYSFSVPGCGSGTTINFNNYQNKKILLVNVATSGSGAAQLAELQQLYLQHKDSMVIIAFPSNSFGNEHRNDSAIKSFMHDSIGISFPVAAKSCVRGDSANVIYQWLGSKLQNELMNARVKKDYQKFLVDKDGWLVGAFDSVVSPLSPLLQNAIHNN
jgi:glutathione peroxidase-family protein